MPTHRVKPTTKKVSPGGKYYPQTRIILTNILDDIFSSSQVTMAQEAGLSPALINRVLIGNRAPTAEFTGAVLHSIPAEHALKLIETYLREYAATVSTEYKISVRKN